MISAVARAEIGPASRLATATVVVGLSSLAGIAMIHSGGLTAFWPANGILLAFLLAAPPRRWPVYLAAGLLANFAAHLAAGGYGVWTSSQVSVANTIEVLIGAWPFRTMAPRRPELTHAAPLARFAFFGGLLGPLASGFYLVCTTPHFLSGYPVVLKFRLWFVGDSLGLLLCAPLSLALVDPGLMRLFSGRRLAEAAGLLAMLLAVATFVFRNEDFPFPFVILVVLIPVIFRLGLAASAVGVLLISAPAIYYTFAGRGPLARVGILYWSLFLQIYFIILLATIYVLSAMRGEEKRLADELRGSEARYRILAETSQDIILRTTVRGVRRYISPSVQRVIGWTEEELPPPGEFAILVHPADRARFAEFQEKIGAEPGSHTLAYRVRKRDGEYCWLEACVGAVFSESGVPAELVWTIRDISLRKEREESLGTEKRQAQQMARTDSLTGLGNRRAFDERLAVEWGLSGERNLSLSLLMLDVDHFKAYNDAYGHQTGDECLRQIAGAINQCTRQPGDMAARYGGEEFAIVLPNAGIRFAEEVAERIRATVHGLHIEHAESPAGNVTVSIGVSSTGRDHGNASTLLEAADQALYVAKRGGRDRVALG